MIVKSSPILQSKTRTGLDKFWQCHITNTGNDWFTQTSYWQQKKSGEKTQVQYSTPYQCYPKNIGRANATTAEQQAYAEFDSIVKKQKDKGYREEGEEESPLCLPMLAQKFNERKHAITWPAYVQPKYNGMRDLYDGEQAWSRGRKLILPEVVEHLKFDTQGNITDGELILPGNPKLQESMKAAKKFREGKSDKLLYITYDLIDPILCFADRYAKLSKIVKKANNPQIVLAPTYLVNNEQEVMEYFKEFIAAGYEGIMIRDNHEGYQVGQRSNQLQKYKEMQDAEWPIVGVREGDGSYKGCATFICSTAEGVIFECNPEGSIEYKKELYKNRNKLIGKFLTIRYQELSNDKVPIFPVGVDIRDPEDFE